MWYPTMTWRASLILCCAATRGLITVVQGCWGAASQWLGVLRALNKTENHGMMTVKIKYGPPYHGKSDEDRIMGQLRQMKESIADERAITTIGGLIAGWRERTEVHRYKNGNL